MTGTIVQQMVREGKKKGAPGRRLPAGDLAKFGLRALQEISCDQWYRRLVTGQVTVSGARLARQKRMRAAGQSTGQKQAPTR